MFQKIQRPTLPQHKRLCHGRHGRCSFNHRKHIVTDGSVTQSRNEDLPTEPTIKLRVLLLGLPVPTHSSERSVMSTVRDQRSGLSPLSVWMLSSPSDPQCILGGSSDFLSFTVACPVPWCRLLEQRRCVPPSHLLPSSSHLNVETSSVLCPFALLESAIVYHRLCPAHWSGGFFFWKRSQASTLGPHH